jgi:phospho-N-acetylmuramoyl-pentapeptide-transferase
MFTIEQLTQEATTIISLSFLTFCIAMLLTPIYTHYAYKYQWWKRHRTHSTTGEELTVIAKLRIKRNIPMMAGLIILAAVTLVTVIYNLDRQQTWLPVAGLRAPVKFAMITAVAAFSAWFFYYKLGITTLHIPFAGDIVLGWLFIPLFILVLVSTGNAVNISDGMDGLAGGLLMSAFTAFGVIATLQGNFGIAAFCMTVVGALLAYVWFNIPPARFIMGDVGSFGLGLALGVVATLTGTLLLLPIIGLVFVAEAGSSLLQILSKKFFHRRIFISAPIHHHLEALDWPKTKVTMRFWVIGQVCAAIGIILALAGGYVK